LRGDKWVVVSVGVKAKADVRNRQKIITLARANIGNLSTSMVRDLEKILAVELTVENEDAE
jgi:hypothetical protein